MTPSSASEQLATALDAMLDELDLGRSRRLAGELVMEAVAMAADSPGPLDLKIAAAAVTEMRDAFKMFAPYRDVPKVTVFGSARTTADDPLYHQAVDVASALASKGWMVVTGAGPGIMQAAMEGAGRAQSIGVSIRLPFESGANSVIAGDSKYVSMRYFFTRKLMLVKESQGFICLPGGFGTLDETFELLTLTQTGKGLPVPIVLLDCPGDPYWEAVDEFVSTHLVQRGLVSANDRELYLVTEDGGAAVEEICGFYANYDSIRYVGEQLVVRLRQPPTDAQLAELDRDFAHLCVSGSFRRSGPTKPEELDGDKVELPRVSFHFAKHGFGELRRFIDRLNSFAR